MSLYLKSTICITIAHYIQFTKLYTLAVIQSYTAMCMYVLFDSCHAVYLSGSLTEPTR